jgi:sugar lactone lactonase YvrE
VAVDGGGNLYVADTGNATIRKVTPGGVVTTLAGTAGLNGSVDGTGAAARFGTPRGVTVDSTGNVYVADPAIHTIRKITPGGVVTTFAGTAGLNGSVDGTGAAAQFASPQGVTVDSTGNVYVAESAAPTVRKITPGGVVTTLVGAVGRFGLVPGPLPGGLIAAAFGVAVHGTSLYITTDSGVVVVRNLP